MFSPEGPNEATKKKIACAFWSLLLESPDELDDFQADVYYPGASIWMHFGCGGGEPYYQEWAERSLHD
jgi:hypothetical protein